MGELFRARIVARRASSAPGDTAGFQGARPRVGFRSLSSGRRAAAPSEARADLVETADLFEAAVDLPPKLVLLIRGSEVWSTSGHAWPRAEAPGSAYCRVWLGPRPFLAEHVTSESTFRHVDSGHPDRFVRVEERMSLRRQADPPEVPGAAWRTRRVPNSRERGSRATILAVVFHRSDLRRRKRSASP